MKTKFTHVLILCLLITMTVTAQQGRNAFQPVQDNIETDWYYRAAAYVEQMEYDFYPAEDHFRTTNSANRIGFAIGQHGYKAYALGSKGLDAGWQVEMKLNNIGRGQPAYRFLTDGHASKNSSGLLYQYGFADIEYINDTTGMRQNFILHTKPAGNGLVNVVLNIHSALSRKLVNNSQLVFFSPGCETDIKMVYEDLKVWDADHKILPSYMQLNKMNDQLSLVVDDKDAVYPLTIDPLNNTPEWTTSADGIIPGLLNTLQLRVNSLYGYTVANLGDINHDTFDDIAIGAPGMANVITGSGNLLGVGAVFIYMGSSTGLQATPSKVLQPSSASAGAMFGFSIDAGNISADGAGYNDLVIGAPLDSYQTTVTGLLGVSTNVNVTAGKVYYYTSETLALSSNPTPAVEIRLEGDNFWSIGVAGLSNNTGVNALYGFSVAVTEDLNNDQRQDVVIGSPAYMGKSLLSVKSGTAFIYYSDDLGSQTPVKLSTPTPTVLGLVTLPDANLDGLLFGYSVEGVGDYNNDGYADVAVGAPAGINLNSLGGIFSGKVLDGSAYIYYGSSSGISTNIGASFRAGPSGLLSSSANLFGYKLKAVRNAAGVRNGNLLISAVSGVVLSNVIGGLRLKAGEVHVFKKKTSAFSSPVNSDQAISSPRSSSVLSTLAGQDLDVSMLFGASMDNMRDVNCDGYADIIVGEPLSANVPMVGADVTGGSAYLYFGQSNGTYQVTPAWTMTTLVSPLLGVNATSLIGFSVAGGARTNGPSENFRAIIGGPTNALDFGAGLLNLGNTMGTLYNFAFDNNGIGKAYSYNINFCSFTLPLTLTDFNGRTNDKKIELNWIAENELNVNNYELQRSADGRNFETIALILAQNNVYNEYKYPDAHPFKGINYYRLKIIDTDKKKSYSKILKFAWEENGIGLMIVAPNPAREVIKVRLVNLPAGKYTLSLFNAAGQLKAARTISINQAEQFETIKRESTMSSGVYWLQLYNKEGKVLPAVNVLIGD